MLGVMRCVLLCILEVAEGGFCLLGGVGVGVDALCATLYAGGFGEWALFRGSKFPLWQFILFPPPRRWRTNDKKIGIFT